MKYKEMFTHILSDTMPNWMKYDDEEKDIRIVRKVYSIGDLRYANDYNFLSSDMSKPSLEKIKRRLPSSSNLTINNNTILTSTLGKLLARKLTHRSTTNMTRSTSDLNGNSSRGRREEKNIITKDCLQFIEPIGNGRFSTVFKALYKRKGNEVLTVAVKKFNISIEQSIDRDVQHPHILQFFGDGVVTPPDNLAMFVMEYAPMKSLYDCLISSNSKCEYSIQVLLGFIQQITLAMSYLEKKSIIHKNLSCRNYLVFSKSLIKLSDWNVSSSPIAWSSPEVIHLQHYTTASDVFSFGISIWECFSYGEIPWNGMTNTQIVKTIDSPNNQRLSRPPYATSELYQIMLHCWKYQPSERPTFSQLEKTLANIELKQVRWKDHLHNQSFTPSKGFLSLESCLRGPLIILDRCLHIPISSNLIQCVSFDGQIGFVQNENLEPIHIVSLAMNSIFSRKTGIKKNSTKTKMKQISKEMISSPQTNLVHAFHVGVPDDSSGEITCLDTIEQKIDEEQPSSLLDEVMQAFTEINHETIEITDRSPSLSCLSTVQIPCRFTRELEERSRNGDLSEQGKHAYNLLINRRISNSSSTHDEHSSISSSSNPGKSDNHSHYSSISSLNSRSSLNQKIEQPSATGQPLPPPPDLSSLGSKLTIATMTETFQLPKSLTLNKYRTKKRFNLFA